MGLDGILYQFKKNAKWDDVQSVVHSNLFYLLNNLEEEDNWINPAMNNFKGRIGCDLKDISYDMAKEYYNTQSELYNLTDGIIAWEDVDFVHRFVVQNSMEYNKYLKLDCYYNKFLTIHSQVLLDLRDRCQYIFNELEKLDESRLRNAIDNFSNTFGLLPSMPKEYCDVTKHTILEYLNYLKYTIDMLNRLFSTKDWYDYIYIYESIY